MFNWYDKPTKAEIKHYRQSGDQTSTVVCVGDFLVTIPGELAEESVTYQRERSNGSTERVKGVLPNIDVQDGEIKIRLEDLVDLIMSRLTPEEVAKTLWDDKDVRKEFMHSLAHRYWDERFTDQERRDFLVEVKETVHSEALGKLTNVMGHFEYEISRKYNYHSEIDRINHTLRHWDVRTGTEMKLLQFEDKSRDDEFKIGGTAWNEARSYWREEVLKRFPKPEAKNEPV